MKHLLTAIACCLAVVCLGQGTTIHEYPWNPDWNNDNFVGSSDLTGFLSAFGSEFGNPPEPCDYDGTEFESFCLGIADGTIELDSIWIEFELEDIHTYFIPGCPDPVTDTLVFVNYAMLKNVGGCGCNCGDHLWSIRGEDAFGYDMSIQLHFSANSGQFWFILWQDYINQIDDGFFGGYTCSYTNAEPMPWPDDWFLDEEGIHLSSSDWNTSDWPSYANYLHILPYWHYAE